MLKRSEILLSTHSKIKRYYIWSDEVVGVIAMNWIFYKGKWYQILLAPMQGNYKLKIPGVRGHLLLSRKQLEKIMRENLGLRLPK